MKTMPERIQRRRTPDWKSPPGAIYVGRPTVFGNPWKVTTGRDLNVVGPGMFFVTADELDTAHEFAVTLYREWLTRGNESRALMCRRDDETREGRAELEHRRHRIIGQLDTLRGRDLSCWCPDGLACHADVLLQLSNGDH